MGVGAESPEAMGVGTVRERRGKANFEENVNSEGVNESPAPS